MYRPMQYECSYKHTFSHECQSSCISHTTGQLVPVAYGLEHILIYEYIT